MVWTLNSICVVMAAWSCFCFVFIVFLPFTTPAWCYSRPWDFLTTQQSSPAPPPTIPQSADHHLPAHLPLIPLLSQGVYLPFHQQLTFPRLSTAFASSPSFVYLPANKSSSFLVPAWCLLPFWASFAFAAYLFAHLAFEPYLFYLCVLLLGPHNTSHICYSNQTAYWYAFKRVRLSYVMCLDLVPAFN